MIVETYLKKWNDLFLKILRLMQKMVLTGCLKKKRSYQPIQIMFFALHPIGNKFFICSQSIFVNIPFFLNVMENGLLNKSVRMQYMRGITFVIFEVLKKSGVIYGQAGIHQKCGSFGQDPHPQYFKDLKLP